MAIFTDSQAAQINGLRLKQRGVPGAFHMRQIAIAVDVMEGLGLHQRFDPFLHVVPEAGRVIGRNAQVFVHVEQRHLRPVDAAEGHKVLQELDLGIAGGQDGGGRTVAGDGVRQIIADLQRHVGGQIGLAGKDMNVQGIGLERTDRGMRLTH